MLRKSSCDEISEQSEHLFDHQTVNSTTNMTGSVVNTKNRARIQSANRKHGSGTMSNMSIG